MSINTPQNSVTLPQFGGAKKAMNKGLGKGLSALLDDAAVSAIETGTAEQTVSVEKLMPSTLQPRREFDDEAIRSLAASIKSQGVLQPLLVRPNPGNEGFYEIIGGERRWRAAKVAGLSEVPVIIRTLDDGRALEVALVENVQRADLNPIDEAAGYARLVEEFRYTHEDMARVTGKSRSHITNLMRLLGLPEKLKACVSKGLLTMGHARALLGLSADEGLQIRAATRVIKNSLSVRETEELVRKLSDPDKPKRGRRTADPKTSALENMMQERLGMKVSIKNKEGAGGSIRIFYDNSQQLADVMKNLGADGAAATAQEVK